VNQDLLPAEFSQHARFTPLQGKQPFLKSWAKRPFTLSQILTDYPEASGVGLLHEFSHTFALDLDDLEWCREHLPERGIDVDELIDPNKNCLFVSPKTNSAKVIFQREAGFDGYRYVKVNDSDAESNLICCFEIRCAGMQDAAPGSDYPGGGEYTHAGLTTPQHAPPALLDFWKLLDEWQKDLEQKYAGKGGCLTLMNEGRQSIIYAFNKTYPIAQVLQQNGYDLAKRDIWLSPNSASNNPGVIVFPSHSYPWELCYSHHASDGALHGRAVDAFEVAAHAAYPHAQINEAKKKFASDMAKQVPALDPETEEPLKDTVLGWNAKQVVEDLPPAVKTFKFTPDAPELAPSLIFPNDTFGELVRAFMDGAQRRNNPVAALVTALGMISTISGGSYLTAERGRTNMEIVIVGSSSDGKTATVGQIRRELPNIKQGYSVYTNISSWEGVEQELTNLSARPEVIFYIDEIGALFKKMQSAKGEGIKDWLMRVWSQGDSAYTTRTSVAAGQSRTLFGVHVTVIGSSTEENLQDAIDPEDAATGSALRRLFFNCSTGVTKKRCAPQPLGMPHIGRLQQIEDTARNAMSTASEGKNIVVLIDEDAYELFNDADDKMLDKEYSDHRWRGKWLENSLKIAACRAIYLNPAEPVITGPLFDWGMKIADHTILYMQYLFAESFSLNRFERARKELCEKLAKMGGDASLSHIHQQSNYLKALQRHEREGLYKECEAFGWIKVYEKITPAGRKQGRVRLVSSGEEDEE